VGDVVDSAESVVIDIAARRGTEVELPLGGDDLLVGPTGEELTAASRSCDMEIRKHVEHEHRERHSGAIPHLVKAKIFVMRGREHRRELRPLMVEVLVEVGVLFSERPVEADGMAFGPVCDLRATGKVSAETA